MNLEGIGRHFEDDDITGRELLRNPGRELRVAAHRPARRRGSACECPSQ
jgi:hypothetical protein